MRMSDLDFNSIFLDRDGDGFVDSIDLQIHLGPSCGNPKVLCAILDLCAAIGFESMGMHFPLVTKRMAKDPSIRNHLYIGTPNELKGTPHEDCLTTYFIKEDCVDGLTEEIRHLARFLILKNGKSSGRPIHKKAPNRETISPLNPFSFGIFFQVSFEETPSNLIFPYKILLFSHFPSETTIAIANFVARLGLESPHLTLPLAFSIFEKVGERGPLIYIGKREDLGRIRIDVPEEISHSLWDSGIFFIPKGKEIPNILITGEEEALERILTYFSTLPTGSKGSKDPVSMELNRFFEGLNDFLKAPSYPHTLGKKIVRNYVFDNGEEEVLRRLKRGLAKRDLKDEPIAIQIMITKPERERRRLAQVITHRLVNMGADRKKIDVKVLNAYKPGLSWMKEVVLKELEKRGADRVEIAFKPFLEKGLEEPLRWLQEVYPIDEIFAKKLQIPKERIVFKKEGRIKETYRVVGWQGAQKVFEAQFSPKWRTIGYLPAFPRMGKVHPCTGWINVRVAGEEVVNQEVRTGIDRIWEIYQKKILPRIEKEADRILIKNHLPPSSPVFRELRFEIFYHYPSEALGIDEERISPLEALHEDLYFVTLDFFSKYSKNKFQTNYAPGRILPVIHPNPPHSKARLRFTLIHRPKKREDWNRRWRISNKGLILYQRDTSLHLCMEAERPKDLRWLTEKIRSFRTFDRGSFRIQKVSKGNGKRKDLKLVVKASGLWSKKPMRLSAKTNRIDIPMERPIGYREGVAMIQSFKDLPGVDIVREGASSGGLSIYSIEHSFPSSTPFISHAKRALLKPTFFINCRHHANEVSSTNAGLKLSHLLATHPRFQKLLKKVNVVINPMENVDGVALLEEMLNLTPKDKLHAGRYNIAGREYYDQYFTPDTPFGEARVKADIWKRWLPDICADNHGFPSHEWEQPFSGYAPFRFREWWIPRTFFFFYLPFLERKGSSPARKRSEGFGKWVWAFLKEDKEVLRRNQRLFGRYWKYRGQWMTSHGKEIEVGTLPLQKRFREINFSYRYPHLTTLDFITEVADEVAWGSWLKDAVTVTLKTHLAVLRLLNSIPILVKKKYVREGATIHVSWQRRRPLKF